jgi:deazaflavin-dependent oxidoreductase (nitroreductase family)
VNAYQSLVRRIAEQRWFAAVARRVAPPLDRLLAGVSRGRISLTAGLAAPELMLTTIGAKTGRERPVPLLYVRDGGGYVVAATNWGQAQQPAWSANLLAQPDVRITLRGKHMPVRARLVDGAEKARLWPAFVAMWPAYDRYRDRCGREVRVFRLEPR